MEEFYAVIEDPAESHFFRESSSVDLVEVPEEFNSNSPFLGSEVFGTLEEFSLRQISQNFRAVDWCLRIGRRKTHFAENHLEDLHRYRNYIAIDFLKSENRSYFGAEVKFKKIRLEFPDYRFFFLKMKNAIAATPMIP